MPTSRGLRSTRQEILEAATAVFADEGYARAQVEAIAGRAGVSKQTVYNHFGDKQALFLAVADAVRERAAPAPLPAPDPGAGPLAALAGAGRTWLDRVLDPDVAALRRLVLFEGRHYPRLREGWDPDGSLGLLDWLVPYLGDLAQRGLLEPADVPAAARQLVALVGGEADQRSMYGRFPLPTAVLDDVAAAGATTVLRAYAARAEDGSSPYPPPGPGAPFPEPAPDPPVPPARGRLAKYEAILAAATEVFLRDGYARTALESVAERAGVSKQTIYNHFGTKERLFLAVVEDVQRPAVTGQRRALAALRPESDDVAATLTGFWRELLPAVGGERLTALRHLVIFEAGHHPELRRQWSAGAPAELVRGLAGYLAAVSARGLLAARGPVRAASQLVLVVGAEGRARALAGGPDAAIAAAVRFLLRAYAP